MKAEEKLKEINHVFKICGITLSDLKEQYKQGCFKINSGLNVKSFEIASMITPNKYAQNKDTDNKIKKKCTLKQSMTMGSTSGQGKKKYTMSRKDSLEKSLQYSSSSMSSSHSPKSKKSEIPSEIRELLIKIEKPPSEQSSKLDSINEEINGRLGLFDQLFNIKGKDKDQSASEYDDILNPMKEHERGDYEINMSKSPKDKFKKK